MRKLINLLAFAVVLFLASCGSKGKYTVTGTVEDSYDGDKVYILESTNDNFTPVDSVVISNGKFVFKGEMGDTPVLRFLAWTDGENDPIYVDFFQEPGAITIKLAFDPSASKISGTKTNDAYQNFRDQIAEIDLKRMHIFQAYTASDATEEQKAKSIAEMDVETAKWMDAIKNSISDHIQSPLSVLLINRYHTQMSNQEVDSYLSLLSASQLADSGIKEINEKLEVPRKTFVGKLFTDLEMLTPEGNPIKLSDYAGKGKVVLIDFWASWCGPCLREMPRLVDAYTKYKDKGFEIIGVSFDRDGEAWKKGIEELNIIWPQMSDLKYWDSEGAKVYAVRSIPHVILLDGEGTIVSRGLHGDALQAKIAELMGERSPPLMPGLLFLSMPLL